MVHALVFACGLLGAVPDDSGLSPDDLKAYAEARTQARRDPAANIRLALWCEAHGLTAERLKHLAIAVLGDPKNTTARGLLGLVAYHGQWERPEQVTEKVRADAELAAARAEYNARREKLASTPDAHWRLALWCEENGLKAEAKAHLSTVVRLDPRRDEAWKRLGYKKHNGRWMTAEQIAGQKAEAEAQEKADRHWREQLEKWKGWLGRSGARRAEAETLLAGVTDPRAVRAVWQVFALGNEADQRRAVQLMGQIDAPMASRALALLAVFSPSAEVRREAIETLRRRDPRDHVGVLISLLKQPLKYEVRPVNGPGSQGVLYVEGERYNVRRAYNAPGLPLQTMQLMFERMNNVYVAGPNSHAGLTTPANETLPVPRPLTRPTASTSSGPATAEIPPDRVAQLNLSMDIAIANNIAEVQRAAVTAQRQLQNDVASIENYNANVKQTNERALLALNDLTGQDLGADREAWNAWWTDQRGYAYQPKPELPKPTFNQTAAIAYNPQFMLVDGTLGTHHSCFGAGTLVRTLDGNRPIEELRVGDQVLTQDTKSGELSFQPILGVFHNPPAPTVKIHLGDESIVATGIHRFWKAGKGWTMARELREGDAIRTLGGVSHVTKVESEAVQPVFNLEVGPTQSFFVGAGGALVHDNSLVNPVLQPFDAGPVLTAR